jgi:hypothetical protein
VAEVDYETLVYDLGNIIGEINDVFPGAPCGPFTFPQDERELQAYLEAENRQQQAGEPGKLWQTRGDLEKKTEEQHGSSEKEEIQSGRYNRVSRI